MRRSLTRGGGRRVQVTPLHVVPAAAAPSCPKVGRSQRLDLVAKKRGPPAAVKQRQPRHEQPKRLATPPNPRRCLTRRRRPRYPATALNSPSETLEEP